MYELKAVGEMLKYITTTSGGMMPPQLPLTLSPGYLPASHASDVPTGEIMNRFRVHCSLPGILVLAPQVQNTWKII